MISGVTMGAFSDTTLRDSPLRQETLTPGFWELLKLYLGITSIEQVEPGYGGGPLAAYRDCLDYLLVGANIFCVQINETGEKLLHTIRDGLQEGKALGITNPVEIGRLLEILDGTHFASKLATSRGFLADATRVWDWLGVIESTPTYGRNPGRTISLTTAGHFLIHSNLVRILTMYGNHAYSSDGKTPEQGENGTGPRSGRAAVEKYVREQVDPAQWAILLVRLDKSAAKVWAKVLRDKPSQDQELQDVLPVE
jgi:hypothetical protein